MKKEKIELLPIEIDKVIVDPLTISPKKVTNKKNSARLLVEVSDPLLESIKNYVYWKRITQEEILLQALIEFMETKQAPPRPDHVKNKMTRGRKKKIS